MEDDIIEEETDDGSCVLCKLFAGFGIALGVLFLGMSIDLLTNGKLSGMIARKGIEDGQA